jgi:hypothetical protein
LVLRPTADTTRVTFSAIPTRKLVFIACSPLEQRQSWVDSD